MVHYHLPGCDLSWAKVSAGPRIPQGPGTKKDLPGLPVLWQFQDLFQVESGSSFHFPLTFISIGFEFLYVKYLR